MISLYKNLIPFTAAAMLTACSSIAEYQSGLPYLEYHEVTADISNRTAPSVNVNFCLVNHLHEDVDVSKLILILFVNDLEIDIKEINYDKSISENSEKCYKTVFEPDVIHNPAASSTLLNTMLDRTYKIEGTVVYDEKEAIPVTTRGEGILH
ncbi:hypothetical protein [Ruminobacter sp.]|uniref:hypothetical protein n=1 Tax=Ruminobacter sp. TaxID=2774296 RepID=UPI00386A3FC7